MRRWMTAGAAAALVAGLGGCDLGGLDDACLALDGPCGPTPGQGQAVYIVGFPAARVDRSATTPTGGYLGRIRVGESVSLHLVYAPTVGAPVPADTVRAVSWETSDLTVASVSPEAGGAGLLVARSPGTIRVSGNGLDDLWACEGGGCSRVTEIEVTP